MAKAKTGRVISDKVARGKVARGKVKTADYRHTSEKRKNIPPAKIAAEGKVPKAATVRYHYSPHLPPSVRFDPTGKADRFPTHRQGRSTLLLRSRAEGSRRRSPKPAALARVGRQAGTA